MKKTCSWRRGFVLAAGLVVSVGISASAFADGAQDLYYQMNQKHFFNNMQSARVAAMAGSSATTNADSWSTLGNPAGLGWMKDAEVSAGWSWNELSGNDLLDGGDVDGDSNDGYVLGAFPIVPYRDALPEYGNIGFGWSGYSGDVDDSLESEFSDWRLHLAYAKAIDSAWSVGYSFGYVNSKYEPILWTEEMNDGIRQAIGAQYKMSSSTTFGLDTVYGFGRGKLEDVSPLLDLGDDERRVRSWGVQGGVAQKMFADTLMTASVDYTGYWQNVEDDAAAWGFRLGVEQPVIDWLTLRAGYRYMANFGYDFRGDDEGGNAKINADSFGAGVGLGKYARADYAAEFRAIGDGDWSHWVTLSVPFSICD